jgi:hypothetical protein
MNRESLLRAAYTAFNARDIDAALVLMTADVDWPNAWEGGRVVGHDGVRDYWTRQWREIDPHVEPLAFEPRGPEEIAVEVHQLVRALDGTTLVDGRVTHVYRLRDGLVAKMDVEN